MHVVIATAVGGDVTTFTGAAGIAGMVTATEGKCRRARCNGAWCDGNRYLTINGRGMGED